MIEVLKFIFRDFWTWLGVVIIIMVIVGDIRRALPKIKDVFINILKLYRRKVNEQKRREIKGTNKVPIRPFTEQHKG